MEELSRRLHQGAHDSVETCSLASSERVLDQLASVVIAREITLVFETIEKHASQRS